MRLVTGEDVEDDDPGDPEMNKTGVKVECQMETSKQKTVTFEFNTTDIVPEEMATTFIREDLLAEEHRTILVEQLVEIVTQLANNPDELPTVSFPPEECFSPTRDKRDQSSEATKTESAKPAEPPAPGADNVPHPEQTSNQPPPTRGAEKPLEPVNIGKRFQVSPVVENKPIVGQAAPAPVAAESHMAQPPVTPANPGIKDTKLEKLDVGKGGAASVPSASLSPNTAPLQHSPSTSHAAAAGQPFITSPESAAAGGHHVTHPSSDVSDLEANLAMVFNTKIPAPSLPSSAQVTTNVQGIVPLDSEHTAAVPVIQSGVYTQQYSEASDSLAVTSETDAATSNSNTVHSTKSLDDCLGEPVKQSTPVVTPDKNQEQTAAPATVNSRFAVKKVEELLAPPQVNGQAPQAGVLPADEPELTALSLSQTLSYNRAAAEAEHYDSSPSPGSCYDTASESVETGHNGQAAGQVNRAPVQILPAQTPR